MDHHHHLSIHNNVILLILTSFPVLVDVTGNVAV